MAQVSTKLKQEKSEGVFQQEIPIGTYADYVVCANGDINLPCKIIQIRLKNNQKN